jgi:hypothetical protein
MNDFGWLHQPIRMIALRPKALVKPIMKFEGREPSQITFAFRGG